MNKTRNSRNSAIVREQTLEWQRNSIHNLVELVGRKVKDREAEKFKRSVKNLFQGILIDMLNGGDPKIGTAMIVRIIAARLNVKPIEVQRCLAFNNKYRPSPNFKKVFSTTETSIKVEYAEDKFTEIILPPAKLNELLALSLDEGEMIHFTERYAFMMPDLGFFWSIHPDAYQIVNTLPIDHPASINTHKIIEGFASPLNYNLPNWCSVYQRDKLFGSMGTFQEVIRDEVTPPNKSIRWIVNPAYTEFIIDVAHREIIKRMEAYPEDEFLLLLPGWPHLPIVEWLVKTGECWYMEGGAYRVYDHVADEDVNVPVGVNMLIGYVRSNKAVVPTVPFVNEVVDASTLAGANPKPRIITIDDIRTNSVSNMKL